MPWTSLEAGEVVGRTPDGSSFFHVTAVPLPLYGLTLSPSQLLPPRLPLLLPTHPLPLLSVLLLHLLSSSSVLLLFFFFSISSSSTSFVLPSFSPLLIILFLFPLLLSSFRLLHALLSLLLTLFLLLSFSTLTSPLSPITRFLEDNKPRLGAYARAVKSGQRSTSGEDELGLFRKEMTDVFAAAGSTSVEWNDSP